jgi:hypothetical protein
MSLQPPRPSSVLASVLVAAGIMLTAAGCSHVTPLGPDTAATPPPPHAGRPTAVAVGPPHAVLASPMLVPPPRQLGSPIILQVMRGEPATPAGGCPVGSVAISVPPGAAPMGCYRPVGTPVTVTSAAVSPVSLLPGPPHPAGHPVGPAQYGFSVAVPAADVAAVTALIAQAHDSRDALGVSAADKLWEAPQVLQPFPGQQLQIALLSKNEALQLYRILIPPS